MYDRMYDRIYGRKSGRKSGRKYGRIYGRIYGQIYGRKYGRILAENYCIFRNSAQAKRDSVFFSFIRCRFMTTHRHINEIICYFLCHSNPA